MRDHVVPVRVYLAVFAALLVLTATTTAVAFLDLGPLNTVIMLAIAVTKAMLVVLYFMHLRYHRGLTRLVLSGGLVWLLVLIVFVTSDLWLRAVPLTTLTPLAEPPPTNLGSRAAE